ncbi:MAG: YHYH protein [Bacteroidota bacterium]
MRNIFTFTAIMVVLGCGSSPTRQGANQNLNSATAELAELDFWQAYTLTSTEYGTKTTVAIKGGKRVMRTNALPNHPTGQFPNAGNPNQISAQNVSYDIPLEPKLSGKSRWAREPGVALNGVKFEPETAERFVCESGEVYRIEAFQELVDLGLDFNHAHVQPTGAYHYHGVPVELVKALDKGEDLVHIGFALDGFPIYYSQSGQYKPSFQLSEEQRTGDACSYKNPHQSMDKELAGTNPDGTFVSDWDYVAGLGDLDECNGMEIKGQYAYFVTDEYPYMSRCLKGEFKEKRPPGPPPGGRGPDNGPPPAGHSHDGGPSHHH